MSQAPAEATEDPTTARNTAFRQANKRRQELLRNGVSFSGYERNCCFLNTGGAKFANISAAAGLDHIGDGRAYALVDWDHDGDLDVWATNRTAPRVQFLRNNGTAGHHFLTVKLEGNGSTTNRDAIGARVELVLKDSTGGKLLKTVHAGQGYLSQSSKSVHFGMGTATQIDRLLVRWPGGSAEEFDDLQADRQYLIRQGSGSAVPWSRTAGKVQLAKTVDEAATPSEESRIALRYRIPLPTLDYEDLEGARRSIRSTSGSPKLISLWASWCQPCLKELVELHQHEEQLEAAGLEVFAVSVDQLAEDKTSNPQAARAFVDRQNFSYRTGFATNELIGKLEAIFYYLFDYQRPWSVPTSLLLDSQGRLAVIYVGAVDINTLLQDVELLSLDDTSWLEASLPFAGRWTGTIRHPNLTALINTFFEKNLVEDGLEFVDKYADALADDPEASPLLVRLAASLRDEGHVVKSKQRFAQAIKANPRNAAAHLELSKLLVQRRQFEEATRSSREAIRLRPENPEAHFFLANLLDSQGDKQRALKHFQRTVELTPESSQARFALGKAFAIAQQWEQATAQLQQSVMLDPKSADAQYQLARVLQKRGMMAKAITHYQLATEIDPSSADYCYALGAALVSQGRSQEAVPYFRQADKLQPDTLRVLNGLAWTIATIEQTTTAERAEAVQLAERAAKQTKFQHPQILDTLAASYAAAGQYDKAIRTAQQAIKLATSAKKSQLAKEINGRLKLYRVRKPYRESAESH